MRTTRAIQLLFMIHATVAGDTLMGHEVRLDATGKIIPWLDVPDPFAKLSELAWQYWNGAGVPFEHGHPLWYWYSSWHPGTPTGRAWPSTPASMSGWLAQVAVAQLAFSGNASAVHQMAIPFCKYVIANGTTPADASWAWGGMPYASADPGNLTFNGATSSRYGNASEHRGDGVGVIEPDKAAEAAWGFLLLANATAEASGGPLRAAAVAVGDTLAANVRAANGTHSPWPFRVDAHSGAAVEEYTSNVVQSLLVLDELQRQCRDIDCTAVVTLRCGGTLPRSQAYARAASIAMAWQRAFPEVNGKWTACCEDVPIDNSLTNYNSMQSLYAAQHLIATRADDWETRAASILEFVETHLIWIPTNDSRAGAPVQWGARTVSEQLQYPLKMGIHTARYAATVAMYNDATTGGANATLRDIAFRSYSWASYVTNSPHPLRFFVNSRTLMGCTPSVFSRVGSKLPLPVYADVRFHIPMTHRDDSGTARRRVA